MYPEVFLLYDHDINRLPVLAFIDLKTFIACVEILVTKFWLWSSLDRKIHANGQLQIRSTIFNLHYDELATIEDITGNKPETTINFNHAQLHHDDLASRYWLVLL